MIPIQPLASPDVPFQKLKASKNADRRICGLAIAKSGDQLILCSSGTSCDGFWNSEVVKGSAGCRIFGLQNCETLGRDIFTFLLDVWQSKKEFRVGDAFQKVLLLLRSDWREVASDAGTINLRLKEALPVPRIVEKAIVDFGAVIPPRGAGCWVKEKKNNARFLLENALAKSPRSTKFYAPFKKGNRGIFSTFLSQNASCPVMHWPLCSAGACFSQIALASWEQLWWENSSLSSSPFRLTTTQDIIDPKAPDAVRSRFWLKNVVLAPSKWVRLPGAGRSVIWAPMRCGSAPCIYKHVERSVPYIRKPVIFSCFLPIFLLHVST